MRTTPSRRALCALGLCGVVAISALSLGLSQTSAVASVSPLLAPEIAITLAPDQALTVRIHGEARVGSMLVATLDGERFDGAVVTYDWLVAMPELPSTPTPAPTPTATPTATATPTSSPLPTPSANPTQPPSPSATPLVSLSPAPTATPSPLPSVSPAARYLVQPADIGHVVRVRATATWPGAQPVTGLSAATAVVEQPLPDPTPSPDPSATPRPTPSGVPTTGPGPVPTAESTSAAVGPDGPTSNRWSPDYNDGATTDATGGAASATGAEPTASAPFLGISVSSDVLLIGGLGVLAVIAGAAIFGRNEN